MKKEIIKNDMKVCVLKCQYCCKTSNLTIDHVVPRWWTRKHWRLHRDLYDKKQVLCLDCNIIKGDRLTCQAVEIIGNSIRKRPSIKHPCAKDLSSCLDIL